MKNRQGFEEKSRLGRLLISRGYLSDSQLEQGLRVQRETGERLGEVFVQAGWITQRELDRVLKHQSRYRNAAAIFTVVALPFQPMVSFAASAQNTGDLVTETGQMIGEGRFIPMTEQDMAGVSGQGDARLFGQFEEVRSMPDGAQGNAGASDPDAIEALKLASGVFLPALSFFDSDLTISGVHYRQDEPRFTITNDGAMELALPERIEQIRMKNIRVGSGPSMGDITITDVRFHAGSGMTVRTR
ncbi:pilus assembly protein PilB [Marinobacter confluentis]|uniref:Pilus assembly protein PilB n=1 Tax=Marinobacter confluentis TaxID=1697557 RepID=A0A4Z1C7W9_9GAMM|nr:pilus assembly protein PilB [Marinobacter confluentis]TGN41750.1 pilus assembly protein PilB [Marinobacter confluentis]